KILIFLISKISFSSKLNNINVHLSKFVKQLSLFDEPTFSLNQQPNLKMTVEQLTDWKTQIFTHQQQVLKESQPQQITLFDLAPVHCDPDIINPFSLQVHNSQFYRGKETGDRICIYFVIDQTLPILLYVGETKQSPKERWLGWWNTPAERRARQGLQLKLIKKWQSPFNKENWKRWGKPFG
ncbi:MAG: hypothetical protein ACRCU2_08730, partial [Planktothrix sp.]